jgi:hypothetical protein
MILLATSPVYLLYSVQNWNFLILQHKDCIVKPDFRWLLLWWHFQWNFHHKEAAESVRRFQFSENRHHNFRLN